MRRHLLRIFKGVKHKLRYSSSNVKSNSRYERQNILPRKNVQLKTIDGADARTTFARTKGGLCVFSQILISMYICTFRRILLEFRARFSGAALRGAFGLWRNRNS